MTKLTESEIYDKYCNGCQCERYCKENAVNCDFVANLYEQIDKDS